MRGRKKHLGLFSGLLACSLLLAVAISWASVAGDLDTTFDTDGVRIHNSAAGGNGDDWGDGVAIQSDGKIVVVGASLNTGSNWDLAVWRFNTDGSLDSLFGTGGIRTHNNAAGGNSHDYGRKIVIQPDGKIVVVGNSLNAAGNQDLAVWRFNSDGSLDTTFGTSGVRIHNNAAGGNGNDRGDGVAIQSDGKIVVVGYSLNSSSNWDLSVWRFNTDGSLDTTFDTDGVRVYNNAAGGNAEDRGEGVAIQSDGKIVVVGPSYGVAGNQDLAVWRFNSDGSLDTTFDTDGVRIHNNAAGGNGEDGAYEVAIQANGKIVAVGWSINVGGNLDLAIWRFDSNGSLDTTFDTDGVRIHGNAAGGNSDDYGLGLATQADGKIVVVGWSINVGGNWDLAVWRFNSNGSLDTAFGTGGIRIYDGAVGANPADQGKGIKIQSDGKIVVVGFIAQVVNAKDLAVWRFSGSALPDTPTITVSASPSSGVSPLSLDFTVSWTGGAAPAEYRWDFDGNGSDDYVSTDTGSVSTTYSAAGTFTARLTVIDGYGRSVTLTATVTVTAPPGGPSASASASPSSGAAPLAVTLTGSATAPAGVSLYAWDFDGNGVDDFSSPVSSTTSCTYGAAGTYAARFRVLDTLGREAQATATVSVSAPAATRPTSQGTASPLAGSAPLRVIFTTAGTAGTNPISYYEWDFDGDGSYDWRAASAGETRAYWFTGAGSVTARQRVVDSIGLSDSNTAAISTTLTDSLVVRIVQPREYGRIAGDVFSVHAVAHGPGLSQQDIASVRFQFKAAASSAYTDIGTAAGVPWKADWTISSLPAGDYHLRAIAAAGAAQATSETVLVTIVADSRAAQYVEDRSGARPRLSAPVARAERTEIQDGRGGSVEYPPFATSGNDTLVIQVLTEADTPISVSGVKDIGAKRELRLASGETQFQQAVTVRIPYADDDNDGIVDGTRVRADSLAAYTTSDGTAWEKIPGSLVRRDLKVIEASVTHHSVIGGGGPEEEGGGFLSFLGGGGCLFVRAGWNGALLDAARGLRDLFLGTSAGRLAVGLYYAAIG